MALNKLSVAAYSYSPMDLLAVAAAREVRDGDIVFTGTGLPMLAIMLAQHTHAPNSVCIYEVPILPQLVMPVAPTNQR